MISENYVGVLIDKLAYIEDHSRGEEFHSRSAMSMLLSFAEDM